MTFVLEKISDENQEKIINAINNDYINRKLAYLKKEGLFPKTRAIDLKTQNFMFKLPETVRPDHCHVKYIIVVEGDMYQFYLEGLFDYHVHLQSDSNLSRQNKLKIQEEITAAFAVYGLNGAGNKKIEVTPIFEGVTNHE